MDIQDHFIAILGSTDTNFLEQAWYHILEHSLITLNMLLSSKLNQMISANTQVCVVFDFNCNQLAQAGCKIIIHNRTNKQPVYGQSIDPGVSLVLNHYQNYVVYYRIATKYNCY